MSDSQPATPPRGMLLDAVFGSEALDSSGEILDVAGADISTLEEGRAEVNYEHKDESGKGSSGLDWVGRIIYAKKIFSAKDCENERQLEYWKEIELPFIYGVVRLYDAAGHVGAQALAAIIRDHHANGEKILWRWSVEGTTLKTSPDKKRLLRSVIKAVALTRKPCNRSAVTSLLADPQAPKGFDREPVKVEKDFLEEVLKRGEPELTRQGFRRLGASTYLTGDIRVTEDQLEKTLEAGSYDAAPGSLQGGAALQREDLGSRVKSWHIKAKKALQKWEPGSGQKFRDYLKAEVPEASDAYLDRFADLVEDLQVKRRDLMLKKIRGIEKLGIELRKAREALVAGKVKGTKGQAKPRPNKTLVSWQGDQVRPGRGRAVIGGKSEPVDILGGNETHMYVVPEGMINDRWSHHDLKAVPRHGVDVYFHPVKVEAPQVIGPEHRHGLNHHPEQDRLIQGIDLAKADKPIQGQNFTSGRSFWAKRPDGAPVFIKPGEYRDDDEISDAHREVAFYNMAKHMGLGEHLPVTAMARHPRTGLELAVVQGLADAHHFQEDVPEDRQALERAYQNGDLGKLALLDHVLGNEDTNETNWMLDSRGKVKRIDHGFAFSPLSAPHRGVDEGFPPTYLSQWSNGRVEDGMDEPVHPEAVKWLLSQDPKRFDIELQRNRVPDLLRGMAVQRLLRAQQNLGDKDAGWTWGNFYGL